MIPQVAPTSAHELDRLVGEISSMGGLAEAQVASALDAVVRRDTPLAEALIKRDTRLDAMQVDIERRAIALIGSRDLAPTELRRAVSALKLAPNLERCGDLARNIAKRSLVLCQADPVLSLVPGVGRMGRLVLGRLKDVLDAYVTADLARAVDVWRRDAEVDEHYEALFGDLLALMASEARVVPSGAHLLFIAKNLERIGDHATNIAEVVHYEITGEDLPTDRPRGLGGAV